MTIVGGLSPLIWWRKGVRKQSRKGEVQPSGGPERAFGELLRQWRQKRAGVAAG